ncbi:glycoside hydrolase family 97 protein [Pedobacter agri]|uniref:glycoside hydrolase family 97 protein n=1 Tax=Pedobacter agri TaxID=454586 RepID=UPI002931E8E7|nr:glycoside hydrolase family 97 catalytic domain-containing protein [Pedobacter agri]
MRNLKLYFLLCLVTLSGLDLFAQDIKVASPNGELQVHILIEEGKIFYNVYFDGMQMLQKSPIGIKGKDVDLSSNLRLISKIESKIDERYTESKIKKSDVHYQANELKCKFTNPAKNQIEVIFRLSNNNIAFRYHIPQTGDASNLTIENELTGFNFPESTTTFLTPQAPAMTGFAKSKPSYEEEYVPDAPMSKASKYGLGYTFPSLFHIGTKGWVLLSETGVNATYCASKLSEVSRGGNYKLAFPEPAENNGIGDAHPTLALPGSTPWRTITLGRDLKPIVETTIPFDVVEQQYQPFKGLRFGRSTWSWLLWQDGSINFEDQKKFIDLSAKMGYEFVLIDNWWDARIGREKIAELATYAKKKNVGLSLWYNSNGLWNDAPQTPKNMMNTSSKRKNEMAWMKSVGIKGIKVDFFGGDKQETIKLYEDILSDANLYGLTVIFHGATLPRGWERMYPNFAGSEAVIASENLIFSQQADDTEAFSATLHPFIRNTVAAMDFGPVLLNKKHNKGNDGGNIRRTGETFQIATSVIFQTPIQNFGITPNNLVDMPEHIIKFMKEVPTTWDETILIDGYPGKFCILARRNGEKWFIAGINAEKEEKNIKVKLPMLKSNNVMVYADQTGQTSQVNKSSLGNDREFEFKIISGGGVVLVGE